MLTSPLLIAASNFKSAAIEAEILDPDWHAEFDAFRFDAATADEILNLSLRAPNSFLAGWCQSTAIAKMQRPQVAQQD